MTSKFLKFFEPLTRIMPEAKQPDREIQFKEKLLWTLGALIIYLIMSQVPLFGVKLTEERSDYFYWMRIILASSKNSLCELGIGPIVTSGLIMQLLAGAKIINVNMSDPVDRGLFTGVQKVITILFTIVQSIMYIGGGQFGTDLDMGSMILIFLQLVSATVIILLLDEMIQKGWGIGSGVSLFIASNVAGQIFWNSFAFIGGSDGLPRGAFMAFFQSFTSPDHTPADVFIRPGNEPGVLGILTTILIFLAVIYVESMRIEIPLSYSGYSGMKGKYPMKLMYVSNIPVILSQAMYANILFFIQLACGPTAPGRSG
ncbi:MAG: preprotein translocase subunit SecY, partial [archaeon]|nr:preprotein translocase subunit SecY [archaeon]